MRNNRQAGIMTAQRELASNAEALDVSSVFVYVECAGL